MTHRIGTTTAGGPTQRAPWYVSLFNPIARPLLGAGVHLGPNALLTVTGRASGQPRTTPLAIVEAAGRRWVWSPWGEVNWVRNLRTAGQATVTVHGHREEVQATELDPDERIAFFRDVLVTMARRIPFGYAFVRIVDGVDLRRPVEAAAGRPVFELHLLD